MAFLEENERMVLNEIAYNISFIYSFDEMRFQTLNWLKMLIGFDGAVFSTVEDGEVKQSVSVGFDDSVIKKYEAKKGDARYFFAKGYHDKLSRDFGLTVRESELLEYAVK